MGKELRDKARIILAEYTDLASRIQEIKASQVARYIHGYSRQEAQRLLDQASTVADYLHYDSTWPAGSHILEVGCGVGAQTQIIANKNPTVTFTSIDINEESLKIAEAKIKELGLVNVTFQKLDVHKVATAFEEKFDHVFVCFLLEHLSNPIEVLQQLKMIIKPTGTITVIEGDHGSTFFHPSHEIAEKLVEAQVDLQKKKGGNANIGRQLFPLLRRTGFRHIEVSPRQIYVDDSRPALKNGFIKKHLYCHVTGYGRGHHFRKVTLS